MPSPQFIYKYVTDAKLQELYDAAIERSLSGQFTSLSGAAKSSSREWMNLQTQLFELKSELDRRGGVKPNRVVSVLNNYEVGYGNGLGTVNGCGYGN